MPRFMLLVIPKPGNHTQEGPSVEDVGPMSRFNEEMMKAGAMLAGDGLRPPNEAVRVTYPSGAPAVTDGPFAEAKELVGGYWISQAASRDEAVEWATRAPMGDGDIIEVRQIAELEDFSEDVQVLAADVSPPEQTRAT